MKDDLDWSRVLALCESISTLLPGKAMQRPACEMYILLTGPGVHSAHVAVNHADIKAQRFNSGDEELGWVSGAVHNSLVPLSSFHMLNVTVDCNKDEEHMLL